MSTRDDDYAVINGWLSQKTDGCNCGPGPMGEHEPHCQWEPLAKVEDIARMDPVDGDVIERAKVVALEGVHREDCFDFEHTDCKVFAGNVVSALADAGMLRNPKEGQTEVELEKTVGRKAEVQCSHCGDRGICPACRGASTGEPGMQCLTCHGTHECPFCPTAEAGIGMEARWMVGVLAEHQLRQHGMIYGSPDRCACGAETLPEDGDGEARVRRGRAFAKHQVQALVRALGEAP